MITLAYGFIYINSDFKKIPYDTLRFYEKDLKKSKNTSLKRYYEKIGCVFIKI